MKKILSLIIVLACALSLFSCGGKGVGEINKMYAVSCPTKIVTTSTQIINGRTLSGSETIIAGKIDGKAAAVHEYSYEKFADIESASSSPIVTETNRIEYLEGYGTRSAGGKWNAEGADFSPTPGSIAITLTKIDNAKISEDKKTFTCTVKAENTAVVFGEDRAVAADVSVTITTNGTVVTGVVLTYNLEATESSPAVAVTITVDYSYDLELITLTK